MAASPSAMSRGNLSEPNSSVWYAFGIIYEQYGVPTAAIAAYKRVEKPKGLKADRRIRPCSNRLKALHVN